MSELMSLQDMANGHLDVKALGEAANEDKVVTSRLGLEYASAPMASRLILEQGTIDATLFLTKADLDTGNALGSDTPVMLVDGDFALVLDDETLNNNGYYKMQSGEIVWLNLNASKQALAEIEQAKQAAIDAAATDAQDKANAATEAAVDISTTYTDESLEFKSDIASDKIAVAFKDESGRVAVAILTDGTLDTVGTAVMGHTLTEDKSIDAAYVINDSQGNPTTILNHDGSWDFDTLRVKNLTTTNSDTPTITTIDTKTKPTGFTAEINGICSYGQSLGMGSTSTPIISDTQKYDNLMFNSGVRTYDGGTDPAVIYASLEPLVESQTNSNGETPISGMADNIKMLISAEDGIDYTSMTYRMLGAAPANSGAAISTLIKGTLYFNRLIDHIKYGALRAAGINSSYAYQATTWLQGEADYSAGMPKATYKILLGNLVTDIADATKLETNQSFNPEFIIGQVGSHLRYAQSAGVPSAYKADIAQAQLELSIERNDVHLACPSYFSDYSGSGVDQVHITATDERVMGAYFGLVYKRVVIDGQDWQPLRPIAITHSSRAVYITLNNMSALTIDTTRVFANKDYGFRVFNDGVQVAITSVSIVNGTGIKLLLSAPITGVMTVDYALATDNATGETGRKIGARGNIRDSQGDTIVFDPTGVNRPLHNWLVMFTYTDGESKWL